MSSQNKIDNSNLQAKLEIRTRLIDAYQSQLGALNIFDACQGQRVITSTLYKSGHYKKSDTYFGVDKKRTRGAVCVDSTRILSVPVQFNVIDLDTYGSPWTHFDLLLSNISMPLCLVFLTYNHQFVRGGTLSSYERNALGLDAFSFSIPASLVTPMQLEFPERVLWYLLNKRAHIVKPLQILVHKQCSPSYGFYSYIGVALERIK